VTEPGRYVSERIAKQADVAAREIASIDPEAGVGAVLSAHVRAIQVLLQMVGDLAAEIDTLRHQLEHPSRN
jgi:hypothetical protein